MTQIDDLVSWVWTCHRRLGIAQLPEPRFPLVVDPCQISVASGALAKRE